ncbi:MAG: FAD:protein FMN transferase [Chloroflexota bacterium]
MSLCSPCAKSALTDVERSPFASAPLIESASCATELPTDGLFTTAAAAMDTVVSLRVVTTADDPLLSTRVERALGWFSLVEGTCSRFDPGSELMIVSQTVGKPVPVSDILYGAIEVAIEVARLSEGAFDPTIGLFLERAGFNRHYLTGKRVLTPYGADYRPTYRDVRLDPRRKTVTLRRPLILDLGAVAKGMAIDLAARELAAYRGFAVEAGGDLYVGGCNERGTAWQVGIKHPLRPYTLIDTLAVSNAAICTSGAYERRVQAGPVIHHILDPRAGASAGGAASATVVAPTAMLADALSTAAFVLGPRLGMGFLERAGVEGLIITPELERKATHGYARYTADSIRH